MRKRILFSSLLVVTLLSATPLSAQDPAPAASDFATVKLFFVNAYLPDSPINPRAAGGEGGFGGGMGHPTTRFETADLFIDNKLVSNVMFRHVEVTPTLNLPSGDHQFRIECDGYRAFKKTLTVLGNGSLQWLVVTLEREPAIPTPIDRESTSR